MAKTLHRVFHLCFGAAVLAVLLRAAVQWQYNSLAAMGAAAVLCAGLVIAAQKLAPAADALPRQRFTLIFWMLALLLLAGLAIAGVLLDEVPIMDWEYVYRVVPDYVENGFRMDGIYNGYFVVCNNNVGLLVLLTAFYKPLALLGLDPASGAGYTAGILLNVFLLWLSVVLACRAAWLGLGRQSAPLLVLCVSLLFAPFYLWAPTFYTDTLCMPFLTGALCCWLEYRRSRSVYWLVGAGALSCMGYAIKGSLVVVPAAIAIAALLEYGFSKKLLLHLGAMALAFAVLLGGYKQWQKQWLDWSDADSYVYPTELWFCYGSHDWGDYSQQDVDDCNAIYGVEARRQLLRARIIENYSSRSLVGNLDFFYRKAARTWGDGWYDSNQFLLTQLHANFTSRFVVPGEPGYMPLTYYCQIWQYLLLLLVGAGGILAARQEKPDALTATRLSLTGVVLFLSVWETKPRYAFHFTPVLVLCAVGLLLTERQLRKPLAAQEEAEPVAVG